MCSRVCIRNVGSVHGCAPGTSDHRAQPNLMLSTTQCSSSPYCTAFRPPLYSKQRRSVCLKADAVAFASVASESGLASYRLPHHSSVAYSSRAPWFEAAIRDVVRHLDVSPFLQLVRFSKDATSTSGLDTNIPTFASFSVPETVVATPELWSSIAEAVTADTADVIILVQRVDPHAKEGAHLVGDHAQGVPQPRPVHRSGSAKMKDHAEETCRKLVESGIGRSILQGHVGECCDEPATKKKTQTGGVVPFSSGLSQNVSGLRGQNLIVKALPCAGSQKSSGLSSPMSGYWGVVVQSRRHTGAEGCYLLKAVRQVATSSADCTCVHFSLTRVCAGEKMERQFVESWLV